MDIFSSFENRLKNEINLVKNEYLILEDKTLNIYIEEDTIEYFLEKKSNFFKNFPYFDILKKYEEYSNKDADLKKILNIVEKINKEVGSAFSKKWWLDKIEKTKTDEIKSLKVSLLNELEKNISVLIENWELSQIKLIKEELIKKYISKLEYIKKLKEILSNLDLGTGYFWDLSKGNIIESDINTLISWVEFLKKNKEIMELCNLLGKMKKYNKELIKEKISRTIKYDIKVPDKNSNEEISGIKLGKSIEYLLPNELALLNDSELEELFNLKYIEEKLMLFDYDSYTNVEKEKTVEDFVESEKDEEKGPIIICVDTSGSMSGAPERIAKAIAFCISSKAISENRPCLLINFSTSIEVIEFNKFNLFTDILNFLKKSFNGGTDLIPALKYSLDKIENEKFEKADVLILSDFILDNIENKIFKKINNAKKLGNRFYSISIGNLFMDRNLNNIFTKQWVYNPDTSNLDLLNEIAFYFDEDSK
jgi:von willebrand factor, type A